jgi:hypothetical protein
MVKPVANSPQERSGPAVANSHRAPVGSRHEGPHDSGDHQLQVRGALTFAMRNRASRDFRPDRTRHELVENLGWQLMQCDIESAALTSASTVAPYNLGDHEPLTQVARLGERWLRHRDVCGNPLAEPTGVMPDRAGGRRPCDPAAAKFLQSLESV